VEIILYVAFGNVTSSLIGTLLYVAYFTYLESSRGQTIGKQLLKLRVVGASGGNPTTQEALTRNAWALLNLLGFIPVVGFLVALALLAGAIAIAVTASQDPQGRGWHDKLAGTTVVKG
jgi:uncharacterized RDD family membrane protein YckC